MSRRSRPSRGRVCAEPGCPNLRPCRAHPPKRSPSSKRTGNRRFQQVIKPQVFQAFGDRCIWCGRLATTVDHLVPVDDDGTDDLSNLRPACGSCNSARGARGGGHPPRENALRTEAASPLSRSLYGSAPSARTGPSDPDAGA